MKCGHQGRRKGAAPNDSSSEGMGQERGGGEGKKANGE